MTPRTKGVFLHMILQQQTHNLSCGLLICFSFEEMAAIQKHH